MRVDNFKKLSIYDEDCTDKHHIFSFASLNSNDEPILPLLCYCGKIKYKKEKE